MKFEIDIDLPENVLREWEPVAIRSAQVGEFVLFMNHTVRECPRHAMGEPSLILRRRFQWPSWLKCRYLTWSGNGCLLLWDSHKPEFSGIAWTAPGGAFAIDQGRIYLQFPGGDWRTRIEENPNWKGGE